jgi:hypothetical protein
MSIVASDKRGHRRGPVMLTLMITGSKKYTEKEIVPFFL